MKPHDHDLVCEKIQLEFETTSPYNSLGEVPNTFDAGTNSFEWRKYDFIEYALMPRTMKSSSVLVDLYVLADEDDLDDINLADYCTKFLHEHIFTKWKNLKNVRLSTPIEAEAFDEE